MSGKVATDKNGSAEISEPLDSAPPAVQKKNNKNTSDEKVAGPC